MYNYIPLVLYYRDNLPNSVINHLPHKLDILWRFHRLLRLIWVFYIEYNLGVFYVRRIYILLRLVYFLSIYLYIGVCIYDLVFQVGL